MTYGLAPNRQNPFAGAAHAAVFNTWRRFSAQVLYVVPPFIAAYYIMNWATERSAIPEPGRAPAPRRHRERDQDRG